MASEWQKVRFGEIYDIPSRNGLTKPKNIRGHGVKFINMGEVFAHDRIFNVLCDRVPITSKEKETSLLANNDLLFARQSLVLSGAGKCSIFLGDQETVAFESHLIRVRINNKLACPLFLFYLFKSSIGRSLIWNITEQGAGQSGIRGSDLENITFKLPLLKEQKAIAHILGSLDDKIELNRQMNATLEAMAQALFKSWFVDFDPVLDNALAAGNSIPDELQSKAAARLAVGDARKPLPAEIQALFPSSFILTEEMGWIPEGWEVKALDNIIELIGGGTPKTSIKEYWNGDIPWFSVVDAPSTSDVFVIETEKNITQIGLDKSSAKLLPVGTTIISARGTVGKCAIVGKPMAMNQSCYGIRGKNNFGKIFTYYTVFLSVSNLQKNSHGSVFSTITRDTFKSIKAAFPLFELTQAYDAQSEGLFNRILKNRFQEKSLVNLRDTLLPKLLSGELRIPDAENLAAEVL